MSLTKIVRLAGLLLFVGVLSLLLWLDRVLDRPFVYPGTSTFEISSGSGISAIARQLQRENILTAPAWTFVIYARITSRRGYLQAGEYRLGQDDNIRTLVQKLRTGQTLQHTITLPEGLTVAEWSERLSADSRLLQPETGLTTRAIEQYLDLTGNLEGLFFPDTYAFHRGTNALEIFNRAQQRMARVVNEEWAFNENPVLKSPADVLVLASIVEKETGVEEDRQFVASVFTNRLKTGMKLQSDPTVIYGIPDFDGDITRKHLREPTLYNTYVIPGLPPTPIANPGLASIRAVLHPVDTDYFYFVAKGDGRSYFSQTLEEHNRAVRQFQLQRRSSEYRSAPKQPVDQ